MTRVTSPLETTVCPREMVLVSLPAGEVGKSVRATSKPLISSSQVTASTHSSWCRLCSQEPEEGWHTSVLQWMKIWQGGKGYAIETLLRNMCKCWGFRKSIRFPAEEPVRLDLQMWTSSQQSACSGWELKTGRSSHWNQCGQITVILVRASERESCS